MRGSLFDTWIEFDLVTDYIGLHMCTLLLSEFRLDEKWLQPSMPHNWTKEFSHQPKKISTISSRDQANSSRLSARFSDSGAAQVLISYLTLAIVSLLCCSMETIDKAQNKIKAKCKKMLRSLRIWVASCIVSSSLSCLMERDVDPFRHSVGWTANDRSSSTSYQRTPSHTLW